MANTSIDEKYSTETQRAGIIKGLEHSLVNNLKVPLKDTPLIFTENAVHNKELRRKLTEYMFET